MLTIEGLNTFYGRAHILADLSLQANPGEVVVLLGRNGAGKSTTMKSVIGMVPAQSGSITFDGARIDRMPSHRIARLGLGYVPEERRIFTDLTVMENLAVGKQPPREGAPTWTPERLFELFPNLGRMKDRPGGRMSGGEQQMLTIARTLMGNPRLILLDEPSEGLAPVIVEQMAKTILQLKDEGLCVLLSEQNLHFAQMVADRAYIIEKGRIRYSGTMAELAANAAVREQYLSV
ncbi:MAG: ABC transporter ATP-binding protein [Ferrovibrio sp.]|jgi:branched-chain amino acid transport system ATP-binding protein|uniref:ABC transporter ATP-binding protein n=1 Tax=Ferrovibrio sp. TaxID=1917215 RepID=UPI003919F7E8